MNVVPYIITQKQHENDRLLGLTHADKKGEKGMKLESIVSKFINSDFLLTVNGICNEWYGGIEELPGQDYYDEYKDCEVKSFSIITTNDVPELIIDIKN